MFAFIFKSIESIIASTCNVGCVLLFFDEEEAPASIIEK